MKDLRIKGTTDDHHVVWQSVGMPRLADRVPQVGPDRLIADLVAPPLFASASFGTYRPAPAEPSQLHAVQALQAFALRLVPTPGRSSKFRTRSASHHNGRPGIYLDGGFGVGKTHLLAALWHTSASPKVFGTFVEFTDLVGALGFARAVEALSQQRLVCIDEFELDDPGDTVLMSSLLSKLVAAGVRLAATSNTLPDRLGEGRFAAGDFLREIQGLAGHFDVVRIDGPDYRHRGQEMAAEPLTTAQVRAIAGTDGWLDDFSELMTHLGKVHPSKYGVLLDDVTRIFLTDVAVLTDQAQALRLVVLADRLYDRDISVVASGVPLDRVFAPEMLAGGYRKKYLRATSRLVALNRGSAE